MASVRRQEPPSGDQSRSMHGCDRCWYNTCARTDDWPNISKGVLFGVAGTGTLAPSNITWRPSFRSAACH